MFVSRNQGDDEKSIRAFEINLYENLIKNG